MEGGDSGCVGIRRGWEFSEVSESSVGFKGGPPIPDRWETPWVWEVRRGDHGSGPCMGCGTSKGEGPSLLLGGEQRELKDGPQGLGWGSAVMERVRAAPGLWTTRSFRATRRSRSVGSSATIRVSLLAKGGGLKRASKNLNLFEALFLDSHI